jgi:multiple sugar transport system substrate-binding protein
MIAVIAYGADRDRTLARAETSINRMLARDAQFQGGTAAPR